MSARVLALAAAAAALTGSDVTIDGVGLNPTRTALIDVLRRFGARVEVEQTGEWQGEPVGRLRVVAQDLGSLALDGDIVPAVIDELPVLAVLATAGGELRVTGASELRVKESDRIAALVEDLHERGLDKDVTVVAWGEFGRTPKINKDAGRDHWPKVSCALLACGGMKTGQTIGATDRMGGEAVDRPVTFQEVYATLYRNLGVSLSAERLFDFR